MMWYLKELVTDEIKNIYVRKINAIHLFIFVFTGSILVFIYITSNVSGGKDFSISVVKGPFS